MTELFIKDLNCKIELNKGLNVIYIENSYYFRKLFFENKNNLSLTNEKGSCLEESYYTVENPLSLEFNNKKIISGVYKILTKDIKETLSKDYELMVIDVISFLNKFLIQIEFNLNMEEEVDLSKFLQVFNVKVEEVEYSDYVLRLIEYFKLVLKLINTNYFLIFNLSNIFDDQELEKISNECELLDLIVIDFSFKKGDSASKSYCVLKVDEDLNLM